MRLTFLAKLAVLLLAAAAFADDNAIVGTWKWRPDLSQMRPAAYVQETAVITQKSPSTWHYVYDFTYADGHMTHSEVDRVFDGTEHPVSEGTVEVGQHPNGSTWITQRFRTGPNGSKVMVQEFNSTISADGKTQTVVRTTVNATETIKETIVFERQ